MRRGEPMRAAMLLLGLALAGCAGGTLPGEQPATASSENVPAATNAPASPAPAPSPKPQQRPAALDSLQLTQARADCWMKVEQQKLRDIDRRIAFVDKCVADAANADR